MSRYNSDGILFYDVDLVASLDAQRRSIESDINSIDQNRLLNTSPDDLVQYFVEKNHVEAPKLLLDKWTVESREGTQRVRDFGREITVPVQQLIVRIPYEGEGQLFQARPSTYTSVFPRGSYDGNALTIVVNVHSGGTPENVRAAIDREVESVQQYLTWIQSNVASHNNQLERIVEASISRRRTQVLTQQGIVSALGIPLRERADAPRTYVAPAVRKKVVPTLPPASTAPYKPEPVLEMQIYEHILEVIQGMTKVMERSPSTFARMDEESLRDHYLVQLNGHYQGSATGETFNASGKTDILIREQDKNIFIGECKFWKGAKVFTDTIDQLLGYSSWRDTKTAILVFNRNRNTSKVLDEVKAATEGHQHYKRTLAWPHESGFRFVMHHPTDNNRELIMTVLVFDIPEAASRVPTKKAASKKAIGRS
ncbi:hypothetical protein [Arenimonas sp.]|uniref:hypothetical protein n=1 Tax=Arenimonas sp. TaxID=1872635 RepID=UPI0025CF5C18|nr:hypothetical protein [Arenimonas sp.]